MLVACGERVESHYATFRDLERASAGARSWMPEWLPESATDIREWHDLDTNSTLVAFTVPNATPTLLSGCKPFRFTANPGSASWWPTDDSFASLKHFECEERTSFAGGRIETRRAGVALDQARNRLYFWR